MSLRAIALSAVAVLALGLATLQAADTLSRTQADAFAKKLAVIVQHSETAKPAARRTAVTENEVNSWFAYRAKPLLPEGVSQPKVRAIGSGKLMGDVVVDFEVVAKKSGNSLLSVLPRNVPVSITGILHTENGRGNFELTAADVSGVPLPKYLLQEALSYYSRSESKPNGIRLDDPFQLPAKIRRIEVGQGQAVVVQ